MEGHPSLLFAHKTDIRKISLDSRNDIVAIVNETRSSCAIDFNFRTGMIYGSDVMTQKIYKYVELGAFWQLWASKYILFNEKLLNARYTLVNPDPNVYLRAISTQNAFHKSPQL